MLAKVVALFFLVHQVHAGGHGTPGTGKCPCIDPVRLGAVTAADGKVPFAKPTTSIKEVPVTYGTGCQAWDGMADMQYYSDCTSDEPKPWCAKKWCYIDMCNCDKSDLGSSSYFTVADGSNLKLGYSYDTCDTSTDSSSSTYLVDYCKEVEDCAKDASCTTGGGSCVPATKSEMLTSLGCTGSKGCQCINPPAMKCVGTCTDGMVPFTKPTHTAKAVPPQYGAGCSAWDMAPGMVYYKDCAPDKANPPSWCSTAWCYIDMCNCDMADIASSSYFNASSSLKLGYSYSTCGGKEDTTGDYLTNYCSNKDAESCSSATTCKPTGNTCGPKASEEIKTGLACSEVFLKSKNQCSKSPEPTCPGSPSGNSAESSEFDGNMCPLPAGMGALWVLASLLLAVKF